jgi:hypothetical protein
MCSESQYASYNLDQLGLIAGMIKELGLRELIDTYTARPRATACFYRTMR